MSKHSIVWQNRGKQRSPDLHEQDYIMQLIATKLVNSNLIWPDEVKYHNVQESIKILHVNSWDTTWKECGFLASKIKESAKRSV